MDDVLCRPVKGVAVPLKGAWQKVTCDIDKPPPKRGLSVLRRSDAHRLPSELATLQFRVDAVALSERALGENVDQFSEANDEGHVGCGADAGGGHFGSSLRGSLPLCE